MISLVGISFTVLFCSLLIKERNKTIAVLLSVSGVCIILFGISGEIKSLVSTLGRITNITPSYSGYLKLMLKVLAITLLTQIVSDICRDNGENALAGATEFGAKIIVISLAFPLLETVIGIVGGLTK